MTVFDIDIVKYDGYLRKMRKDRNVHAFDVHGCVKLLVCLADELLYQAILVEEHGDHKCNDHHRHG